jgi:hypothetical protein
MTPLSKRKTRLTFITADEVYECGKRRAVIIEAHPGYALVRLQGLRTAYTVPYAAVYSLAVKQALSAERREKAAKKKIGGVKWVKKLPKWMQEAK